MKTFRSQHCTRAQIKEDYSNNLNNMPYWDAVKCILCVCICACVCVCVDVGVLVSEWVSERLMEPTLKQTELRHNIIAGKNFNSNIACASTENEIFYLANRSRLIGPNWYNINSRWLRFVPKPKPVSLQQVDISLEEAKKKNWKNELISKIVLLKRNRNFVIWLETSRGQHFSIFFNSIKNQQFVR